ncbi:MAG: hypothetical protein U1E65_36560 [Myxococcota bacterium]
MRATALFPLLALACAHAPPPPADPNAAFHERYARAVAYDQAAEARPQLLALAVHEAGEAIRFAERAPDCCPGCYCPPRISMTGEQPAMLETLRAIAAKVRPPLPPPVAWTLRGDPSCRGLLEDLEVEARALASDPSVERPIAALLVLSKCQFDITGTPKQPDTCSVLTGYKEEPCHCPADAKGNAVVCDCPGPIRLPAYEPRPCTSWTMHAAVSVEGSLQLGATERSFRHAWAEEIALHEIGGALITVPGQVVLPVPELAHLIHRSAGLEPEWGPAYAGLKPLSRAGSFLGILELQDEDERRAACIRFPLARQLREPIEIEGLEEAAREVCRSLRREE